MCRLQSRHQEDAEALRSLKDLYRTEQETVALKSEELAQVKRKAEENAAMVQVQNKPFVKSSWICGRVVE